jgi:hypothetical protein
MYPTTALRIQVAFEVSHVCHYFRFSFQNLSNLSRRHLLV